MRIQLRAVEHGHFAVVKRSISDDKANFYCYPSGIHEAILFFVHRHEDEEMLAWVEQDCTLV